METDHASVLVVDDNEGCRDLYSHWLDRRYDVETAPDGREALRTLTDHVDVLLLDRYMPGPSGIEVAELVLQRFDCAVVMVSSSPAETDVADLPVDEYVEKPVDRGQLRDLVRRHLAEGTTVGLSAAGASRTRSTGSSR